MYLYICCLRNLVRQHSLRLLSDFSLRLSTLICVYFCVFVYVFEYLLFEEEGTPTPNTQSQTAVRFQSPLVYRTFCGTVCVFVCVFVYVFVYVFVNVFLYVFVQESVYVSVFLRKGCTNTVSQTGVIFQSPLVCSIFALLVCIFPEQFCAVFVLHILTHFLHGMIIFMQYLCSLAIAIDVAMFCCSYSP